MLRITRRKKTDDGVLIPDWARRGQVSLSQFGMDGPVFSHIDFRVEPHDGLVETYFTGQTEDGEMIEEVDCGEFPLADGLLPLLRLDTSAGGPMFDSMRLGGRRTRELAEKGLSFSPEFADHEARFIRFIWGLPDGPHRVAMSLPSAWWLHWFEHAPDLTCPNFERTAAIGTLGSSVDLESIRTTLLDANPESDSIEWLRRVDLKTLDVAVAVPATGVRRTFRPTSAPKAPRPNLVSVRARLATCERVVSTRLDCLRRYRLFLEDADRRLDRIEETLRSSDGRSSIDADTMFLAVNFLTPPIDVPSRAEGVIDWIRVFTQGRPRWWDRKHDTTAPADDDIVTARITGYSGIRDTDMLGPQSPLRSIARSSWGDFGRAALPWLLGPRPDVEAQRMFEAGGLDRAACRIAHGVAMVVGHRAHRESKRWQGPTIDWAPLADLAAIFPEEVAFADGPTIDGERFPFLERLRTEFGCAEDASVATTIEATDVVRDVFETCMRPLGISVEEIQDSRILEYVLLWEAWRDGSSGKGGGQDDA